MFGSLSIRSRQEPLILPNIQDHRMYLVPEATSSGTSSMDEVKANRYLTLTVCIHRSWKLFARSSPYLEWVSADYLLLAV